jgi:hypothetical protein
MSRRRKVMAQRTPLGRISHKTAIELPPTEVRRLAEAAASGLRDQAWGSQLGRLYLTGQLTSAQFAAGKRWHELSAAYSAACQAPLPPRTKPLDGHRRHARRPRQRCWNP